MDLNVTSRCYPAGEKFTVEDLHAEARGVEALFVAMYQCAEPIEHFKTDIFMLLDNSSYKSLLDNENRPIVAQLWAEYRKIWTEVRDMHNAYLREKDSCSSCIEKTMCPCFSERPDFHALFTQLQDAMTNAEVQTTMEQHGIAREEAEVMVALRPLCRMQPLEP